jgi:hypothetical protein
VEKAKIIAYFQCVSVPLVIQNATRMRHIVICGLSGSTIFFPTLSHKQHEILRLKIVTGHKMCVLIFTTTFVCDISRSK